MSTLVIVEHDNQVMNPLTRHVVAAAKQLNQSIKLLVIGYHCQSVAEEAARIDGVETVWTVDHECYEHQFAENVSQVIASLSKACSSVLAASSTYGKNILPRVAALLDVAQVSDVVHIVDKNTFDHPIYAGNAIERVRVLDDKKILAIRTTAFDAVTSLQESCPIEQVVQVVHQKNTQFIGHQLTQSARPDLNSAKIVVSGGRGLQNAEKFKLVEELADVLGAAVGASRAAVDAGFVPNDYQVGQTGKVVAPNLYIAIGISGAVQHLAGMKDSKVIVAINKDADAPIFQVASYGLVGDLFVLVPELIDQLKQR